MADKVAELYAQFRVDFQRGTLDVLNTTLGELKVGTLAEIATLAGLTHMLFQVGAHATETATHLYMLGKVYGLNTQELQNMARAGLAANVSTEKFEASVLGLQNNLASLNLGQVNDGFLRAAGFFGLHVGPGMSADAVEKQMIKAVPSFVKAHGAMGRSMASVLLSEMGMDPDMLNYFMTGKKGSPGQNITEKNIAALAASSAHMNVLGMDIKNLGANSIAPLVDVLGDISAFTPLGAAGAGSSARLAS